MLIDAVVVHVAMYSSRHLFIIHVNISMSVIFIIAIIISILMLVEQSSFPLCKASFLLHFILWKSKPSKCSSIGKSVCMHESTTLNIYSVSESLLSFLQKPIEKKNQKPNKAVENKATTCFAKYSKNNEQWELRAWSIKPMILYNYIAIKWSSIHYIHSCRNWRKCRSIGWLTMMYTNTVAVCSQPHWLQRGAYEISKLVSHSE